MEIKKYHKYSRWTVGDGRDLKIMPRDLEYLYQLFIHGPLPTTMLHALVSPQVKKYNTTTRMMEMRRKPMCLVDVPPQTREHHNANYQPLTYKITKAGVSLLLSKGRVTLEEVDLWRRLRQNYHNFHHDAATAYYTASIQLGCIANRFDFLAWDFIFTRPKCPDTTKQSDNPLRIPYALDGSKKTLIPDALFAIKTPDGFSCFAFETDMKSESLSTDYTQKFKGYINVLEHALYKTHWGISSLQVLHATTNDIHKDNMQTCLKHLTTRTHPHLFKSCPFMSRYENNPVISGHMLTTEWERVGHEKKLIYK